jgi:hypothetical protein
LRSIRDVSRAKLAALLAPIALVTMRPVLSAQAPAETTRASTRAVLGAILSQFPEVLAHQALDSSPPAWQFRFPDDTSEIDWAAVRAGLSRTIRWRAPRFADNHWNHLFVRVERVTTDSLSFAFSIGVTERCGEHFLGTGATYGAMLVRAKPYLRPRVTRLSFSDSFGCGLDPRKAPQLPPVTTGLRGVKPVEQSVPREP